VKRAMLAIEVHRHRSSPTLDRHGIYGGLDLAAADRAPLAERELAVYCGLQAALYALLATRSCPSRRPQRAAEMVERAVQIKHAQRERSAETGPPGKTARTGCNSRGTFVFPFPAQLGNGVRYFTV
jgi:hypothetical protein